MAKEIFPLKICSLDARGTMDILSFPVRFPQSQPVFSPNLFDPERSCDKAEQLKDREARLETRRKFLCFGGNEDSSHLDAGMFSLRFELFTIRLIG